MDHGFTLSLSALPDELIFSESSPLRLLAGTLSGFDSPSVVTELVAENGGRSTYMKKCTLDSRVLSFAFELCDMSLERETRDKIARMTALGRAMTLRTVFLGRSRKCEVVPYKAPEYCFESLCDRMTVRLSFVALTNYFTEDAVYTGPIPRSRAVGTLPLTVMPSGALLSLSGARNAAQIYNPGECDCPITVELYANGSVTDPSLMLGERKITLRGTLEAGDTVTVKSGCSWHRVSTACSGYEGIDRSSRFFSLPSGTSTLVLNAASGVGKLRGSYEFEPRYLGM